MNNHSDVIDTVVRSIGEGDCENKAVDSAAVARVSDVLASDPEGIGYAVDVFGAMADGTRLRILRALMLEPLCVCDLAAIVGISQSGVSHQLRVLRERSLVTFTRDGKRAVYDIADDHVRELLIQVNEHARELAGSSKERESV